MNAGGVLGLFVVLLSEIAHAQPARPSDTNRQAASQYVDEGLAAQERGDFDTAIALYSSAYELVPHPILLFNIAQAHRLAGRVEQAAMFYQRFLATNPTGPEAKTAREVLAEFAEANRMQSPRPERAHPGATPHSVERPPADQGQGPRNPPSPPVTNVSAVGIDSQRPPPWYTDKLGDALVIGGAAATVVAAVVYLNARSDADASRESTDYRSAIDLDESASKKRAYSLAFAVAGGSLVVAGIFRYVVHDRTIDAPRVDVARTHGGGMVTYQGRF